VSYAGADNCILYLLSFGVDLNSNPYRDSLKSAAVGGHLKIFRIIYEDRKATLSDKECFSIEVASCRFHSLSIVKFLCLSTSQSSPACECARIADATATVRSYRDASDAVRADRVRGADAAVGVAEE
jgi:hypothetical protein